MEMAGAGLEFIADHYPSLMELIRRLIEQERLELISSTYAPNLWIGFPKRDLIKSVKINRRCLERLGLKPSRMFFAQEAFFGPGIRVLDDYFDVALCKDDYLAHFLSPDQIAPIYRHGKMRVLVAANHLVGELTRAMSPPEARDRLCAFHRHTLSQDSNATYVANACAGDTSWFWYHAAAAVITSLFRLRPGTGTGSSSIRNG